MLALVLTLLIALTSVLTTAHEAACTSSDFVIPVISLLEERDVLVEEVGKAARDIGFLYIKHHGVPLQLLSDLQRVSKDFFNLPLESKRSICMTKQGKAWRGFFAVGDELTSGIADEKEGERHGNITQFLNISVCGVILFCSLFVTRKESTLAENFLILTRGLFMAEMHF